jgi:hypothetical protein
LGPTFCPFAVDTQGKPTTADGNIQAMYRFRCDGATSNRIDKLGIRLSDQLTGLEKLKLQVATEKGEIAQELSPAPSQQRISRVKGYHLPCPLRISARSIRILRTRGRAAIAELDSPHRPVEATVICP